MTRSSAVQHFTAQDSRSEVCPDIESLRSAFSQLPSGVVVITSTGSCGEFAGATVSSFTSLSFKPPLVVFGLSQNSTTLSAILGHGHFAVHVVAEPQQDLAMRFASSGADKFNGVDLRLSPFGVPLLTQFDTCFQCTLERAQPAGDHQLLIGRVLNVSLAAQNATPVAWLQRRFHVCERLSAL
ncbi:flavin reductase family protein [Agrobacterium rhizogenes]|uniref:flavin reductase family protein n=1 Tax=Rhizobium rhizogenes TaxID=359 RepID=UPI000DE1337B|nr:flavin reductase family protein [Rhizobium rhizogenes]KAA6487795.1 flavin reductase [Agrobacterium sp. ICMP 7243]NTF83902.1 flavin reductase family protein [Rhizobium rhizogenes]NTF89539.1 flavin reductase family protein [Rhizobium rhizogenes]NTG03303.1 flavin reductase family protein [Rhizobium rhizogenes]NTG16785.1 flavin reductase family protein [Rhizobium rhizogenes]